MATVLHSWLNQAQEHTRYDSVTAKYGLVVDTPSGMSQTGQNALRFLRSLSEHSPTFFEDQARLLSPPTPDLLADLPVVSPTSPPPSALATPIPMAPARRPATGQHIRTQFEEALFSLDMPPNEQGHTLLCPAYTPHPDLAPLGGSYFPPPPDPSPSLNSWDKTSHVVYGYPQPQNYPSPLLPFSSPQSPDAGFMFTPTQQQPQQQLITSPEIETEPSELEMRQLGGDADRARMSALMYGSMRARAVAAATEADGQGW
ncbi:hypothetical protein OPQ81_010947 [Rhizoctonia solani]|nr:hypothetical protein OPQ81_010947 [Rhizoctonia solani]